MTLFEINTEDHGLEPEFVRVNESHLGKGVCSVRGYPATAVIGQINGEVSSDPNSCNEYSFELTDQLQLNPIAPFRFLNHSCEPNCNFELIEQPAMDDSPALNGLFLIALRNIMPDEPLTIDYNWSADSAIPCACMAPTCRGWVVAADQLANLA